MEYNQEDPKALQNKPIILAIAYFLVHVLNNPYKCKTAALSWKHQELN